MHQFASKLSRLVLLFFTQTCFLWALSVKPYTCPELALSNIAIACGDPISPTLASTTSAPSFTTQNSIMTFHLQMIANECDPTGVIPTGATDVFAISTGGTESLIYRLYWDGTYLVSEIADGAGMTTLTLTDPWVFFAAPLEVVISINFETGEASNTIASSKDVVYDSGTFTFQSDWSFDSSTKFYLGSSPGGTANALANFAIDDLRVFLTYLETKEDMERLMFNKDTISLVRRYKMDDDQSLSIVSDSINGKTTSISGPNSPTWIAGKPGLEFTSQTQYLEIIPTTPDAFTIDEYKTTTFSFWFRYETLPTGPSYIFQCWNLNDLSTGAVLELLADGNLQASFPTLLIATTTTPLPLSTWTLVTVSFHASLAFVSISIHYGPTLMAISDDSQLMNRIYLDSFRIGGFVGKIVDFSIYNEGSFLVAESCPGTTPQCNLQLGRDTSNPLSCLNYDCDSNCLQCSPYGCLCSIPSRWVGEVCACGAPDPTYSDGADCHLCPDHCTTCSNAATCLTCEPGFGLSNKLCVSCSSGTSFDDNSCGGGNPDSEPNPNPSHPKPELYDQVRLENLKGITSPFVDSMRMIMEGKGAAISLGLILDMVSNIKYFNISYSPKLQEILYTWNPDSDPIFLEIPMSDSMQSQFPQEPLPYAFSKYDLPSSFLVNFWSCFVSVLILAAIVIWFRALEAIAINVFKKGFGYLIVRRIRFFLQNYLIAQIYSVFGEIICYSGLGFRTATFNSAAAFFSFLFAVLCVITVFCVFYFNFYVIRKFQKIKNSKDEKSLEEFKEQNAGNKFFFDDLKEDSLLQQSYLLVLVVREFIFYLILTVMPSYPLAQNLINLVINLCICVYLMVSRPFEKKIDAIQQYTLEFTLLNINVCLIVNSLLDERNTRSINFVGNYILTVTIIMNILILILMPISLFLNIREGYLNFKEWRMKGKIAPASAFSPSNDEWTTTSNMTCNTHTHSQIGLKKVRPKQFLRKVVPGEQDGYNVNHEDSPFAIRSPNVFTRTELPSTHYQKETIFFPDRTGTELASMHYQKETVFFPDDFTPPHRETKKYAKKFFETEF